MKKWRVTSLLAYAIALVLVLGLSNAGVRADYQEGGVNYKGLKDFQLSDPSDSSSDVRVSLVDGNLYISGNGKISRDRWELMKRSSEDILMTWDTGEMDIIFESEVYAPVDSREMFSYFRGEIRGFDNLNLESVVTANLMFSHSSGKFDSEFQFSSMPNLERCPYMFYNSEYSRDVVFDISKIKDTIGIFDDSKIENITINGSSNEDTTLAIMSSYLKRVEINEENNTYIIKRMAGPFKVTGYDDTGNVNFEKEVLDTSHLNLNSGELTGSKFVADLLPIGTSGVEHDLSRAQAVVYDGGPVPYPIPEGLLNVFVDGGVNIGRNVDYIYCNQSYQNFGRRNISLYRGGFESTGFVSGNNSYTGTLEFPIYADYSAMDVDISFVEKTDEEFENGVMLSDVALNFTGGDPNLGQVQWLRSYTELNFYYFGHMVVDNFQNYLKDVKVEKGKAYWAIYNDSQTSTKGAKKIVSLIPWQDDSSSGSSNNDSVGGDILPVNPSPVEDTPEDTPEDVQDNSIPEKAPSESSSEVVVAAETTTVVEEDIDEDAIPEDTLPQTGGIPISMMMGLGAMIVGSGIMLKRR